MLFIKHGECSSSDWYWSSFGWQFGRRTETIRWTYIHIHIYHSLRYWGSLHMMLLSFSSKIGVSFSKLACIFNICSSMVRNCHILEEPFNLYIQIWSSSIFNQSILESKSFPPWLHPCIFNLHENTLGAPPIHSPYLLGEPHYSSHPMTRAIKNIIMDISIYCYNILFSPHHTIQNPYFRGYKVLTPSSG